MSPSIRRSVLLPIALLALTAAGLAGCAKPISFQVIDRDYASPLPGVRIYRHSVSIFTPLPSRRAPRETNHDGEAVVDIPSNPTNLTFLRQGYEPTAIGVFRTPPPSEGSTAPAPSEVDPSSPWQAILRWDDLAPKITVPVQMQPLRAGVAEITVVDERGAPLQGCEVLAATFLYLPIPGAEPEWGFPALQSHFTDEFGHSEIRTWSGFRNRITARMAGRCEAIIDLDGAETTSVRLESVPALHCAQRIRVLDAKKRPISGATVSYGEIRNGLPASPNAFIETTDKDGFTPPVPLPNAQPLLLRVTARGYRDRMTSPLWRSLDDGGTWRVIMEKN